MFRKLVASLGNEVNYGASFDVVVLFTKTTMDNDQLQLEIVNFHLYKDSCVICFVLHKKEKGRWE